MLLLLRPSQLEIKPLLGLSLLVMESKCIPPSLWLSPAFLSLIQFYVPGKAATFTACQQVLLWAGGEQGNPEGDRGCFQHQQLAKNKQRTSSEVVL